MKQQTIAVVWEESCVHSVWHKQIFQSFRKAAAQAQYAVEIVQLLPEADLSHYSDIFLILGNSHEKLMGAIQYLSSRNKQMILAGMDADSLSSQVSCVTHSRSRQMLQMIEYMRDCGRERMAIVGAGKLSLNDGVKVEAALRYTKDAAFPIEATDVFSWNSRLDDCFDAFMERASHYDAVICPNDYVAFALLRKLVLCGIRVPEDLFVAGFSDQAIDRYCTPSITSITMDYAAVGSYAFSVWQHLRSLGKADLVCKLLVPGRLIVRGSTAFVPVSSKNTSTVHYGEADEKEQFYHNATIERLMLIENCLTSHDELDMRIIEGILQDVSYEALCDKLYISQNALHYRVGKLYKDVNCRTRAQFTELFRSFFGTFTVPKSD